MLPPCPIKGVKVAVAPPKLVKVTTPVTVVLALAVPGKEMAVLMSDSSGLSADDAKLLATLISGTVLVPTLPLTTVVVVPTNTTVLVEKTPAGASVTGAKLCVPLGVTRIGVKVVVALPRLV